MLLTKIIKIIYLILILIIKILVIKKIFILFGNLLIKMEEIQKKFKNKFKNP